MHSDYIQARTTVGRAGLYHEIEEMIREMHSYNLPILDVYPPYLAWLDHQLGEGQL